MKDLLIGTTVQHSPQGLYCTSEECLRATEWFYKVTDVHAPCPTIDEGLCFSCASKVAHTHDGDTFIYRQGDER